MNNKRTKLIAYSAVFTALTFVVTFFTSIEILPGGIINFGDAVILITAFVAGPIPAMIAGGVGSALVNVAGRPNIIWAPFTLVIKGGYGLIAGLIFKAIREKNKPQITEDFDDSTLVIQPESAKWRTLAGMVIASVVGSVIMITGYFFARWLLIGVGLLPASREVAILDALFWAGMNSIQMVVSSTIAVPTALALRKIMKSHIY